MWPFGRKKIQPVGQPNLPVLPFKSGESFFEMQCKFGHTEIVPKRGIVALVLSISRREKDGIQTGLIKVASSDGGFQVFAETPSSKGDDIKRWRRCDLGSDYVGPRTWGNVKTSKS